MPFSQSTRRYKLQRLSTRFWWNTFEMTFNYPRHENAPACLRTMMRFHLIVTYLFTGLLTWSCQSNWMWLSLCLTFQVHCEGLRRMRTIWKMCRPYYVNKLIITVEVSFMWQKCLDDDTILSRVRNCVVNDNIALIEMSVIFFYEFPWWQRVAKDWHSYRGNCVRRQGEAGYWLFATAKVHGEL